MDNVIERIERVRDVNPTVPPSRPIYPPIKSLPCMHLRGRTAICLVVQASAEVCGCMCGRRHAGTRVQNYDAVRGEGGGGGFRVERSTSTNELHLDVGKPLGIMYYTQV